MKLNLNMNVNLWAIALLIVVALWLLNRSHLRDQIDMWQSNYVAANGEIEELRSEVDSVIIAKNRVIELTNKRLKKALESDSIQRELANKYKKLASAVKVEWRFKVDTVEVEVPILIDRDTTVKLWYDCFDVDVKVQNGKIGLYNFYIENRQDIVIGERRTSLFKTEQSVMIRNTNPCITTVGATAYKVVVPKKWYEKWWITGPIGLGLGYGLAAVGGR